MKFEHLSELLSEQELEQAILSGYLQLTGENRRKVISYLAILEASQCTPTPFFDFQR